MVEIRGASDSAVESVKRALQQVERDDPTALSVVYRQNSASLRIRVIASLFEGMDRFERHDRVWPLLENLDDEVVDQISVLLLLTPREVAAGRSFMNLEFDDPTPTRL